MPRHRTPAKSRPDSRFELKPELIGKGAYSSVYAAIDHEEGVDIIAKRMDLSQLEDVFYHEIDVMQKLDHPNIVKFIHQKRVGYSGYIYMERVHGINLYDYVNRTGRGDGIPLAQALDIFSQMVHAVEHMHAVGISHHDIKTENIVVTQNGSIAKLIDFGLALYYSKENIVSPGGSPLYSSPEVLLSLPHDPSLADIYSLGVVFYYMLAGQYPWNDVNNLDELMERVANKDNPRPSVVFPEKIPESLRNLLHSMFSFNPLERPSISACHQVIDSLRK
eukprot:TRINITY_DN8093_c0_g1_i1.p1 TRINITY_DN8093_c0_g1~~TRINITY_DN8093_c0_g1_i1.p1  ORF type:complete len:277 (-),score=53.38 TRINITY_DN8093_c0_g1_i1:166-996(-)